MSGWNYTKGLHDLGGGSFAWLQPDGSWGWSNAGLVCDGDESLLVDTLFDVKLTREMLAAMRRAAPAADAHRHARQHARERRPLLRQLRGRGRADHGVAGERARRWTSCRRQTMAGADEERRRARAGSDDVPGALLRAVRLRRNRAHGPDGDLQRRAPRCASARRTSSSSRSAPRTRRATCIVWVPARRRRLHRRHPVHRRHADHVGGADRELDRRLRAHRRARRRRRRAGTRPDHRREGRSARARLSGRSCATRRACASTPACRRRTPRATSRSGSTRPGATPSGSRSTSHSLYREWSGGAQGGANALELFALMAELAKRGSARGG